MEMEALLIEPSVALPAVHRAIINQDAELLQLGAQWDAAEQKLEEANDAFSEAYMRFEEPPIPAAAFRGPHDEALFGILNAGLKTEKGGRIWYGRDEDRKIIQRYSEDTRSSSSDPLPEFIALRRKRAQEIMTALNDYDAEREQRRKRTGLARTSKRLTDAHDALDRLYESIIAIRPRTRAGFKVKAKAVAFELRLHLERDFEDDKAVMEAAKSLADDLCDYE
jgi:hypothetical protein